MSNRLTFSLASLILIFAMALAPATVMAAAGGPTVTITDNGTAATPSTRAAFLLKFTFSHAVEGFATGDAQFRMYDKNGALLGSAADATLVPDTNDAKVYTASVDVSTENTAVGFRVTVAADAATGSTTANSLGNQAKIQDFDLPPLVTTGSLTLSIAEAATQDAATDGKDYVLTVTYKSGADPPAAATPSTVPSVDHLTFSPAYLGTAVLNGATGDLVLKTGEGAADGVYDLPIVHPTGAPDVMIGVQASYIKGVKTITVPPPVTAKQNPPEAMIAVSDHDPTERTYRVSVTFTPAADSLGNAGAAIKDFDSMKLEIKDASTPPADVLTTVEAERKADNSYTAILKYDRLSTTPLTIKVNQKMLKTSNPDHSAMVGMADPGDDPVYNNPPAVTLEITDHDPDARSFQISVFHDSICGY